MRLYTILKKENEYVAVQQGDNLVTLDSLGIDVSDMNDLILRFETLKDKIIEKLSTSSDKGLNKEDYKLLAPIPVPLQDVLCLGVNYKEHIDETTDIVDFTKKNAAVYFSKRVNRSNDPNGIIPAYDIVTQLDYEVELGVIIGKDAYNVKKEDAAEYIFGYTIINDVSARNLQFKHNQWYFGKSLDGYAPMGPVIVTSDEIGDAHNLDVSCYVNGEKRQSSNTSLMITTVEEAIEELSIGMTLKAGTIIATGTPGGVALGMPEPKYLQSGDVVRCEIENIGVLENVIG